MTPRVAWLFALFLTACSTTVTGIPQDHPGTAGAAGDTGVGGGAGMGTGASATGAAGTSGGSGGLPAAAGAGGDAQGLPVDVVPGVATDCVFPSTVHLPPLVAVDCQNLQQSAACMTCTGDCLLPFTFSDLTWDYSTLTLTFTTTMINNGTFQVDQGMCGATPTTCDYQVFMNDPSFVTYTRSVKFQKMDRGYVGTSVGGSTTPGSTAEACSRDPDFLRFITCVQTSWVDYWYSVTIPCAS